MTWNPGDLICPALNETTMTTRPTTNVALHAQISSRRDAAWFALDVVAILEPGIGGYPVFRAIDRNNYDVDCDHTGFFSNSPTGYGRTPLDAIIDLLDNTVASGNRS